MLCHIELCHKLRTPRRRGLMRVERSRRRWVCWACRLAPRGPLRCMSAAVQSDPPGDGEYLSLSLYIYICIYRERERDNIHIYIYIHIYLYLQ